jgi:DNA-directed RNA polymerase II subunit RPB2
MDIKNIKMSDTNQSDTNQSDKKQITTEQIFKLIDLYYKNKNVMFHHGIQSYENTIESDIINYIKHGTNTISEHTSANTYHKHKFVISNLRIVGPTMDDGKPLFPAQARQNSITYSIKLIGDIKQVHESVDIVSDTKTIKEVGHPELNITIATLPLMVRSKWCSLVRHKDKESTECEYDVGGYFIVGANGNEKVIISQDSMVSNKPLVFQKKESGAITYTVQVNSKSYHHHSMTQVASIKIKKDNIMILRIPIFNEINVIILMRALGIETDHDILKCIVYDMNDIDMIELVRTSIDMCRNEEGKKIHTKQEAYDILLNKFRIGKHQYTEVDKDIKMMQKRAHLEDLLHKSFLPHIGGLLINKAYYVGYMINRLLKVFLKRTLPDDRDSYVNKRIDMAGDLIFELFKQNYKKMLSECKKHFDSKHKDYKNPISVIGHIKPQLIEQGLKTALSTGIWPRKVGVAQILGRMTYLQTIAFMRRIDAPSNDSSNLKLTGPRHLHFSASGFLCPVETPEHAKIGLTKHLNIFTSITIMSYEQYLIIRDYLVKQVEPVSTIILENVLIYKVFLNGEWLGVVTNGEKLYGEINEKRYAHDFDPENVSVVCDHIDYEIRVYCCSGRLYRPVLRVTDNKILLSDDHIKQISTERENDVHKKKIVSWKEFLIRNKGIIDYIDMEVQPYIMLADKVGKVMEQRAKMDESINKVKKVVSLYVENRYDEMYFVRYTHCEFHPSLLLGEITTTVPFSNYNYGPRNIFGYSQMRQAMGIYATDYNLRLDISFILYHVQKPLVSTRTSKYVGSDNLPAGRNATVGLGCYTGFNQEDSIVVNGTAVGRGLFGGMHLKKYISTVSKNPTTSEDEYFMKPDSSKVMGMKYGSYEKLNEAGYVPEETKIFNGDIIIGKVTPINEGQGSKPYRDNSEAYKMLTPGVIHKVYSNMSNPDGYKSIKMQVRSDRKPRIGDKFCSRHGNKGTIGMLLNGPDMPFTDYGIKPDMIINPNGIPSRMSVGQLIECLLGKLAAIEGECADGTAFEDHDIDSIRARLKKHGFDENGYEYLYNGMTGERIKTAIFIGPTFYQRLKHLVEDKIHSRARGPRTLLTRQPPEGRSRDGGLRIGEMERDTLIAHGLAKLIKEKLMDNSDPFIAWICDNCGLFAQRSIRRENETFSTSDDIYQCNACNNQTRLSKIKLPYSFKLFTQELMSMCIFPRLRV